jgi:hypothetical protein
VLNDGACGGKLAKLVERLQVEPLMGHIAIGHTVGQRMAALPSRMRTRIWPQPACGSCPQRHYRELCASSSRLAG